MNKLRRKNNPGFTVELSLVMVSFNNEKQILPCLDSLYQFNKDAFSTGAWEVILLDNHSVDNTTSIVKQKLSSYPNLTLIEGEKNLGFAGGNNLAVKKARGEYLLLINTDTIVEKDSLTKPLAFLKSHPDVGAVGIKTVLGNGQLDYSCRRGFPTPWNALCYFSGLTKLFPTSPLFSGYTLGYLDPNASYEVDSVNGAFLMIRKSLGDYLNWFDPDYYWNGEDLDFCYRIKKTGSKIFYLGDTKVIHYKGSSGGHKKGTRTFHARFAVMEIFYKKHYQTKYPAFVRWLVLAGIKARKLLAYILD